MAAKSNPTVLKRQKELTRQQRQREKAADRAARKEEKKPSGSGDPNEDPDLAGIVPGPQPPQF